MLNNLFKNLTLMSLEQLGKVPEVVENEDFVNELKKFFGSETLS